MFSRVGAVLVANVREVVFIIGLGLVSSGLAMLSVPAALIVPGALLTWLAIPPPMTKGKG